MGLKIPGLVHPTCDRKHCWLWEPIPAGHWAGEAGVDVLPLNHRLQRFLQKIKAKMFINVFHTSVSLGKSLFFSH